MVNAINAALSGLSAASRRVQVSAANIANQQSTKTVVDGNVVNSPYVAQRVKQVSLAGGGVITQVRDVNPTSTPLFDPDDPDADANGFVAYPNVKLENEIVEQKIASYDYKANLKTIKVQQEMEQSLLDILS
ncbi:MAG: flagellar basal body rod protein FlgC [Alphaproteobacteria bacterium]